MRTYKCHINIFMHFASVFCFIYETVIPNKSLWRVNIRNKNRNRDRVKERDHLNCKQTLSSSLCYCFHSLYTWFGRNKLNSFRTFWNSHLRHSRTLPTVRPLFKAIYCLSNVPKLRMERQRHTETERGENSYLHSMHIWKLFYFPSDAVFSVFFFIYLALHRTHAAVATLRFRNTHATIVLRSYLACGLGLLRVASQCAWWLVATILITFLHRDSSQALK